MGQPQRLSPQMLESLTDLVGYAAARVLEALLEGILALEFLERDYTRNAAGKAFQAWRALTAAILALEKDKIAEKLRDSEQRRWLMEKAVTRTPSSRLKILARLVEEAGYTDYSHYTNTALDLHDHQYHGPDPEEAAHDTASTLDRLAGIVENRVKPILEKKNKWSHRHEETLQRLREILKNPPGSRIEAPHRTRKNTGTPRRSNSLWPENPPAYQEPGYFNNAENK